MARSTGEELFFVDFYHRATAPLVTAAADLQHGKQPSHHGHRRGWLRLALRADRSVHGHVRSARAGMRGGRVRCRRRPRLCRRERGGLRRRQHARQSHAARAAACAVHAALRVLPALPRAPRGARAHRAAGRAAGVALPACLARAAVVRRCPRGGGLDIRGQRRAKRRHPGARGRLDRLVVPVQWVLLQLDDGRVRWATAGVAHHDRPLQRAGAALRAGGHVRRRDGGAHELAGAAGAGAVRARALLRVLARCAVAAAARDRLQQLVRGGRAVLLRLRARAGLPARARAVQRRREDARSRQRRGGAARLRRGGGDFVRLAVQGASSCSRSARTCRALAGPHLPCLGNARMHSLSLFWRRTSAALTF